MTSSSRPPLGPRSGDRPDRRSPSPARALAAVGLLLVAAAGPSAAPAEGTPSDGAGREEPFPPSVEVVVDGAPRVLELTGRTVREKFFLDIYRMAHYMESPPAGTAEEVTAAVLAEGRAKRIVMRFVRDVPRRKILDSLREGLRANTTPARYRAMAAAVERFCTCISRSAETGDVFELLWLPGGAVSARFGGEEVFAAHDPAFARALWSIWFGERAVVDPEELVSRLAAEGVSGW